MCSSSGPNIAPVAAEAPPPAAAPEKAPQQTAGVRVKKAGVSNPNAMSAGTLLTGPSGIQASALNTGGASLLGS